MKAFITLWFSVIFSFLYPSAVAMGLFHQDEVLSDALKLAFAAGMLSSPMSHTIPPQIPLVHFALPTCYHSTNPTTTEPLTTSNSSQPIPGLTKTLQPSYVAVPLYTIFTVHPLHNQMPPPQWASSSRSLNSPFWDVVRRTAELSALGVVALAQLFLQVAKATPTRVRNADSFPRSTVF